MKEREITAKDIKIAQNKAFKSATRLNKALGLSYFKVVNGNIYEVFPDGKEKLIGKAKFARRKVDKKHFELNDKD